MPPARKFEREEIIDAACAIVRQEGIQALNARRLAGELNCSVQPIYRNFTAMEQLKDAVFERILNLFHRYMLEGAKQPLPYRGIGLSYIRFARDNPRYFDLLFSSQTHLSPMQFIQNYKYTDKLIRSGQQFSGLSPEQQQAFHVKVWIFTHGVAALAAAHTVELSDREIETLLADTVRQMLIGYRTELKEEKA